MQERLVNGNMTFKDYQIVQSVAGYAARWDIEKENVLPKALDQGEEGMAKEKAKSYLVVKPRVEKEKFGARMAARMAAKNHL